MATRLNAFGRKPKSSSHKTAKRLAVKAEMFANRKPAKKNCHKVAKKVGKKVSK